MDLLLPLMVSKEKDMTELTDTKQLHQTNENDACINALVAKSFAHTLFCGSVASHV